MLFPHHISLNYIEEKGKKFGQLTTFWDLFIEQIYNDSSIKHLSSKIQLPSIA